jgi:hypothetical protein
MQQHDQQLSLSSSEQSVSTDGTEGSVSPPRTHACMPHDACACSPPNDLRRNSSAEAGPAWRQAVSDRWPAGGSS